MRSDQSIRAVRDYPSAVLADNPKRDYLIETKYTEIERENRLLFEKISRIMGSQKKERKGNSANFRSLNRTFRKRQHEEIQVENMKILERIRNQRPSINFGETEKSFWQARKRSVNISNIHKYKLVDYE